VGETKLSTSSRALLTVAAIVLVFAGLKWAEPLIVPLLVAACVAASISPIVHFSSRRGLPTYAGVTLAIVLALAGLVAFGGLAALAASDLGTSLPRLERALTGVKLDLAGWLAQNRLARLAPMVMSFDPAKLTEQVVAGAVMKVPDALSSFGMVLFVAVFILLEATTFEGKLSRAFNWRPDRFVAVRETIGEVQKYLLVKTWLSAGMGVLCGAWCAVMGLDYPVLWGLVTFALNYIPVFGALLAILGPLGMALLERGPGPALGIAVGLLVIHNVIANVVEPKVLGHALGLSALVVTLSIIVWGFVLGPVGAILSVPITMVIKIALANTENLRWAAVLLGPGDGREEERYVEARRRSRISTLPRVPSTEPSVPHHELPLRSR
jgi:AI-2 transport protein TqsA